MLRRSFYLSLCLTHALLPASAQERPALTFPVACTLGESCVIQNFVDRDAGPGLRDYACGAMTYDGHDGTDMRLPTLAAMRAGVNVLAAADGFVLRLRDGEPDVSIRDPGAAGQAGRECGNAVLIDHGGGWTSQYCHLKRWSVKVNPGARVKAGQIIGQIGLSGRTEFLHLHFTVRQNGKIVDPQAPDLAEGACGAGVASLWKDVSAQALYRDAFILNRGFADGAVTTSDIEDGAAEARRPSRESQAILAFVRTIGLKSGDEQELTLTAPNGAVIAQTKPAPLDRLKAIFWISAGRKRAAEALWPEGRYEARYVLRRAGALIRDERFALFL